MTALEKQGAAAQAAARVLALASIAQKNQALEAIAQALSAQEDTLLQANAADLAAAQAAGTRPALLDRLALNPERVASMAQGVRQVAALPDPTATAGRSFTQPNGLRISRRRASRGAQLIWGVMTQFFAVSRGLSAGRGSVSATSTPAA